MIENLNIKGLIKNKKLSKYIHKYDKSNKKIIKTTQEEQNKITKIKELLIKNEYQIKTNETARKMAKYLLKS